MLGRREYPQSSAPTADDNLHTLCIVDVEGTKFIRDVSIGCAADVLLFPQLKERVTSNWIPRQWQNGK